MAMQRTGSIGRADLLKALKELDEEARAEAAEFLGFTPSPRKKPKSETQIAFDVDQLPRSDTRSGPTRDILPRPLLPTPFWRLERYTPRSKAEFERSASRALPVWTGRPTQPPPFHWI